MKKYLAELVGTFALVLIVALSLRGGFAMPTPLLAGITLGLFVYTIGHISGAHINPSITLGAWSIGKIKTPDVVGYLVAQFVGAGLAMLVAKAAFGGVLPALPSVSSVPVFFAEALGAVFFGFGVASAIYGKTPADAAGVAVGGSLFFGILIAAGIGSLGVLNPAVAMGIGVFNFAYLLGPIVGVIAGMWLYKYLMVKEA